MLLGTPSPRLRQHPPSCLGSTPFDFIHVRQNLRYTLEPLRRNLLADRDLLGQGPRQFDVLDHRIGVLLGSVMIFCAIASKPLARISGKTMWSWSYFRAMATYFNGQLRGLEILFIFQPDGNPSLCSKKKLHGTQNCRTQHQKTRILAVKGDLSNGTRHAPTNAEPHTHTGIHHEFNIKPPHIRGLTGTS